MRAPTALAGAGRIALLALLVAILGVSPFPATADALDDAKAQGLVGEQPDGYLGLVKPNAPEAVVQLVRDINGRRLVKYREIADKRGTSVEGVAALAGAKLIERARPGQWVKAADGKWVRK